MVPFEALDVTQIQIAKTKTPVAMVVGQPNQPIGYFIVLSIALALVAIASSLMPNATQATRMQTPRSVAAFLAISRLRDGLTTIFFKRLRHNLSPELFL